MFTPTLSHKVFLTMIYTDIQDNTIKSLNIRKRFPFKIYDRNLFRKGCQTEKKKKNKLKQKKRSITKIILGESNPLTSDPN